MKIITFTSRLTLAFMFSNTPFLAPAASRAETPQSEVASACSSLLSHNSPKSDPTTQLIAYLNDLLANQIIGDDELIRLIQGLEQGEFVNPISEERTWVSSAAYVHHEAIQAYENAKLDKIKILQWAKSSLKEKSRVRERRDETKTETQRTFQKSVFKKITPRNFEAYKKFSQNESMYWSPQVSINLTNPIEVGVTHVTQMQWVELMGENPAVFGDGPYTSIELVNGKLVKMQADNPVENLTWWSALEFANRLSIKHGLKPAYDLHKVKFLKGTSAEAGTLADEGGKLIINAPGGDIYKAEGFRLPTDAESEYLRQGFDRKNNKFYLEGNEIDLNAYAWFRENTTATQPVAALRPLVIDGNEFYDLLGNVSEWNQDWRTDEPKGGNNPSGPAKYDSGDPLAGKYRSVHGGCFLSNFQYGFRHSHDPNEPVSALGVRLLRTLPADVLQPVNLSRENQSSEDSGSAVTSSTDQLNLWSRLINRIGSLREVKK